MWHNPQGGNTKIFSWANAKLTSFSACFEAEKELLSLVMRNGAGIHSLSVLGGDGGSSLIDAMMRGGD